MRNDVEKNANIISCDVLNATILLPKFRKRILKKCIYERKEIDIGEVMMSLSVKTTPFDRSPSYLDSRENGEGEDVLCLALGSMHNQQHFWRRRRKIK